MFTVSLSILTMAVEHHGEVRSKVCLLLYLSTWDFCTFQVCKVNDRPEQLSCKVVVSSGWELPQPFPVIQEILQVYHACKRNLHLDLSILSWWGWREILCKFYPDLTTLGTPTGILEWDRNYLIFLFFLYVNILSCLFCINCLSYDPPHPLCILTFSCFFCCPLPPSGSLCPVFLPLVLFLPIFSSYSLRRWSMCYRSVTSSSPLYLVWRRS